MKEQHTPIIFFIILVLLTSSMYACSKDKKCYSIEREKRISKMVGMDGVLTEEIHYEYYVVNNGKRSAIVIGYVIESKEHVTLYITENSFIKPEQTFPIDDKMEIEMLDYVMRKIKNNIKHHNFMRVELSMKTCGVANLNISKYYWKAKRLDNIFFQQPLFCQIRNVLKKYSYEICGVSKDDFYPIEARKIGYYHVLSDTYSQNSIGIDGIIILKCKKEKH